MICLTSILQPANRSTSSILYRVLCYLKLNAAGFVNLLPLSAQPFQIGAKGAVGGTEESVQVGMVELSERLQEAGDRRVDRRWPSTR